jgi:hypothetical protein
MSRSANGRARARTGLRQLARDGAALAAALATVAAAGGCAKPGLPGGGPPDELPPQVLLTRPTDGQTGVDRSADIEIDFSEEMNRQTVERSFAVVPRIELRNFRWNGRTLVAEPEVDLPESTTVVVRVGENAQDGHGVTIASAHSFAFSTGDAIDRGVISGSVSSRGQPVASAVVWACRPPVVPDSLGVLNPCGYVSSSDTDGVFRITNVRPAATPYTIVAFVDRDGDRRYGIDTEAGRILASAAFLTAQADSVGGIELPLEQPGEEEEASPESQESPGATGDVPPGETGQQEETPSEVAQ